MAGALPPDPYDSADWELRTQTRHISPFRGHWFPVLRIMTSYIMYDILQPSLILKIWQGGANFISGGEGGLGLPW